MARSREISIPTQRLSDIRGHLPEQSRTEPPIDPPVERSEWGPGFREYTKTFRHRLHSAFERYVGEEEIIVNAPRDLIPLPLLETTLAVGENMHVVGFQTGDQIFPILMDTIKEYTTIYDGRIFGRYYGFLCIRHLVRMVCVGTLTKCGIFETVLNDLDPTLSWVNLLGVLSDATLLCMQGLIQKYDRHDSNSAFLNGPLFLGDTALDLDDAKFLLGLLWNDRASIIPLRAQDALPGLPALILVLSQLIAQTPFHKVNPDWLCIQDISLRCYLGCLEDVEETDEERFVLRRINQFVLDLFNSQNVNILDTHEVWLAVDDHDARTVVKMYSNLSNPDYSPTPLIFNYVMLRWVFGLLRNPNTRRPELDKLAPSIFKTALTLLQVEIDQEAQGLMDKDTRTLIRISTHDTIHQIIAFGSSKPDREVRDVFLKTVFDSDICGIIGRVLALITRETDKPHDWGPFLDSIIDLGKLLGEHRRLPPAYSELVRYEWSKLFFHFMHLGWGVLVPSATPRRLLENAQNTWFLLFGYSFRDNAIQKFMCAYPRCADPEATAHSYEIKHVCGQCGKAKYCSLRCQLMHWKLGTSGSHSRECGLNWLDIVSSHLL